MGPDDDERQRMIGRLAEIDRELRERAVEGLQQQFVFAEASNAIRTRELEDEQAALRASLGWAGSGVDRTDDAYSRPWAWVWTTLIAVGSAVAAFLGLQAAGLTVGWSIAGGIGGLLLFGGICAMSIGEGPRRRRRR